jgi:hypothetical protein
MMGERFLIVAEKKVIPVLAYSLEGLRRWTELPSMTLVVPSSQRDAFLNLQDKDLEILADEDILPSPTKKEIEARLGALGWRAGWYLQQFIKLGYSRIVEADRYVIWDADTVLIRPMPFFVRGVAQIGAAKEYHAPYFRTYEKIVGSKPVLPHSSISQYMPIHCKVARDLLDHIEERSGKPWVEAILSCLPCEQMSEFSEYETYANYASCYFKHTLNVRMMKWFRYGSEVFDLAGGGNNETIESYFNGYTYVAFERHASSFFRNHALALLRILRISS